MELRYQLTDEDTRNALRASSASPWSRFLFILLLALLFLVGVFLIGRDFALAGWVWLSASVATGIAAYEVPRIQARRAVRRNPSMRGQIVLTFNEEGMSATFSTGKSQLEWRAYVKYRETAQFFLLYMSPSRSTFVPKRVMSPQQVEELRKLLRAHIPSKITTNQTT